jgi:membrane-associated protease RseP (regulator of RpoE activity)
LARWLAAASLLVVFTVPALAASDPATGKGWLGVSTQPTDDDLKSGLDLTQDGLLVNQVTRESPAYRAGLKKGDVILTYNSRSVTTPEQLRDLVRDTAPGRSVALGIWRNGARRSIDVKLGDVSDSGDVESFDAPVPPTPPAAPRAPKAPKSTRIESDGDGDVRVWVDGRELSEDEIKNKLKDMKWKLKDLDDLNYWDGHDGPGGSMFMAPAPRRGRLGVRVDDLDKDMADALGVTAGKGALVRQVIEDTPAQKAGIRAGDVIVKVGEDAVDDANDLTSALRDRQGKVSIELLRKGARRTVQAELPSRESSSGSWMRIPEPGNGSWGYWKSKDDAESDAALRREIEDLKKEIQELRDQMLKTKK